MIDPGLLFTVFWGRMAVNSHRRPDRRAICIIHVCNKFCYLRYRGAMTARRFRYNEIAGALRARITGDEFTSGALLPSESELSTQYQASRVTIRKALDVLRDERLVSSRQGSGWYVGTDPLQQPLDRLDTIEHQLMAQGRTSARQILQFGFVRPAAEIAGVLGCDEVLEVVRLNLADGQPFALVKVWCHPDVGASLSRRDVEARTFHELLGGSVGRATQTIGATGASVDVAALLAVPERSPLLEIRRTTASNNGQVVLVSEHLYPAHSTEFVVELAPAEIAAELSGLRLVQ